MRSDRLGIFGPGIPGAKVVSLDAFFDYIESVERSGDEASIYAAVAWVFRCLQIRSNAIASLPREIKRGETVVDWKIPLRDLLWKTEAALSLFGAAYWWKKPKTGELKSLQWLNPLSMRVAWSEDQGISHFEQQRKKGIKRYDAKEIVYFRSWNPSDDFEPGIAPGRVALEAAGLAKNANEWAASFFENGAIPSVIFTVEGRIDEAEQERVESVWQRTFGGVKNAFKTLVMGSGADVHTIGSAPEDVAMSELMEMVRQQIAVAFGVPQTLIEDSANYASAKEHRKSLYTETIIPESLLIEETLNDQLFSQLPRPLVFGFTPESMEIMQEEEKDRSEALLRLVQAGVPLQTAIAILGIDVPEGFSIAPMAFPGLVPAPQQVRNWQADLKLWERKAIRQLEETDSAACGFDSEDIPYPIAASVKRDLMFAKTPNEVKAVFAGTFQNSAHFLHYADLAQTYARQIAKKGLENARDN